MSEEKRIGIGTKMQVILPLRWVAELIALDTVEDDVVTEFARGYLRERAEADDIDALLKSLDSYTVYEIRSSMASSVMSHGLRSVDEQQDAMLVTLEITEMEAVRTLTSHKAAVKKDG